ncbi:MAG: hypothetical protein AAF787_07805 [Chloroflexota bacterium]
MTKKTTDNDLFAAATVAEDTDDGFDSFFDDDGNDDDLFAAATVAANTDDGFDSLFDDDGTDDDLFAATMDDDLLEDDEIFTPVAEADDDFDDLFADETPEPAAMQADDDFDDDAQDAPIFEDEDIDDFDFAAELPDDDDAGDGLVDEALVAGAAAGAMVAAATASSDDEPAAAKTAPDWLTYDPDDELLRENGYEEEEATIQPVASAPDWLNAMVPGLDLDYDARTDEPVESEFIEAARHRARETTEFSAVKPQRDFEWLVEIVEKEGDTGPTPMPRRRFVFTNPPLWLRQNLPASPSPLDDLADDGNLPEDPDWLDGEFEDDFDFDRD